jgi:hypothetical protein
MKTAQRNLEFPLPPTVARATSRRRGYRQEAPCQPDYRNSSWERGATFENGGAIRCVADYSENFGSNGIEVCF